MSRLSLFALGCLSPWLAAPGVWAQSVPHQPLNDTGLRACEVNGTWQTACRKTGQDAAYGRDAQASGRNDADGLAGFVLRKVCGNGQTAGSGSCPADPPPGLGATEWACVKDTRTGLLWERKTNDGGLHDRDALFTQVGDGRAGEVSELVTASNRQRLCGVRGWRLPTREELMSIALYDRGQPQAMLEPVFFGDALGAATMSGEFYVTPGWQWVVDYRYGSTGPASRFDGTAVRLVRGGLPPPAGARYEFQNDAVLDHHTGLLWQRCALGQTWTGNACSGTPTLMGWREALTQALSTAVATGQAWRLPNVKELSSLIDTRNTLPAADRDAFPSMGTRFFWTSTAAVGQAGRAMGMDLDYGYVGSYSMTNQQGVRLVRQPDATP